MKLKRKLRNEAEIDVTSFSDIAFLLIIFFILTTTFVKPFGHQLDIPSGTSDATQREEPTLSLALKDTRILYGDKAEELSVDTLRTRLHDMALRRKPESKRMVVVESAEDVPYHQYFEVVMAISQEGGILALLEEDKEAAP